jgi:hypothetical protein
MKRLSGFSTGRMFAITLIVAIGAASTSVDAKKPTRPPPPSEPPICDVSQPTYVLFLDGYPSGSFHLATLPCLADNPVDLLSPQELVLDLPRRDRRRFQVANGDVFYDGSVRRIVFGGRTGPSEHWGIYEGVIDIARSRITEIKLVVNTPSVREEDPRFSADGQWIIYKRNGEIWRTYADDPSAAPSLYYEEADCELWAPAMFANVVSYVRRCASDANSDRIVYHVEGSQPIILPSDGGGPDRFAHFTQAGELVYSHLDTSRNASDLWMYVPGSAPFALYSETTSDDDAYAERNGNEYIAFSGWGSSGYDLYVFSRTQVSAIQLTAGINVLGSVLFD